MRRVRLETVHGAFITDGEVDPQCRPPQVVTWGSRVFVLIGHPAGYRTGMNADVPTYREASPVQVINPPIPTA